MNGWSVKLEGLSENDEMTVVNNLRFSLRQRCVEMLYQQRCVDTILVSTSFVSRSNNLVSINLVRSHVHQFEQHN